MDSSPGAARLVPRVDCPERSPPAVRLVGEVGGGPDTHLGHVSIPAPKAFPQSPSLAPTRRVGKLQRGAREVGSSLSRDPQGWDLQLRLGGHAGRSEGHCACRRPAAHRSRAPTGHGSGWGLHPDAPPLHNKRRSFRPRLRRNAEEMGLLERK